jgi:hypothetical protein
MEKYQQVGEKKSGSAVQTSQQKNNYQKIDTCSDSKEDSTRPQEKVKHQVRFGIAWVLPVTQGLIHQEHTKVGNYQEGYKPNDSIWQIRPSIGFYRWDMRSHGSTNSH